MEAEAGRAAIWEVDPRTGQHRIFASGLRNPVGLAWEPVTGALWTSVNERDEIGSDLVPDYMTWVTAVRSKSEQFQLVAVFGSVEPVGCRQNRRLDRHFLEYCDRKDL